MHRNTDRNRNRKIYDRGVRMGVFDWIMSRASPPEGVDTKKSYWWVSKEKRKECGKRLYAPGAGLGWEPWYECMNEVKRPFSATTIGKAIKAVADTIKRLSPKKLKIEVINLPPVKDFPKPPKKPKPEEKPKVPKIIPPSPLPKIPRIKKPKKEPAPKIPKEEKVRQEGRSRFRPKFRLKKKFDPMKAFPNFLQMKKIIIMKNEAENISEKTMRLINANRMGKR